MSVFAFDESLRQQVRKVIGYANLNIYSLDDILDMKNGQMVTPGEKPEHLVRVPFGRWICYYLVDHPVHGRCHYFSIKPDASGKLPDKATVEHIVREFGIENPLLDKHITIDKKSMSAEVILPVADQKLS